MTASPFCFPQRYDLARKLLSNKIRVFETTSAGRLFDAAAALLGFTGVTSYEGQAAIWVEQLARQSSAVDAYAFPGLDWRPLLAALMEDRIRGRDERDIARAFQRAIAQAIHDVSRELCEAHGTATVVLSGGVFQNDLLLADLKRLFAGDRISVWTNSAVPPNDGGISLGQAAIAAFYEGRHA
jgi:hydrogenase maturation protein HypF